MIRRKRASILLAGLLPLVVRALLLPWMAAPSPRIHDEFSYLLAADTFAHGRLVNPVHPMWPHFESMHILVRPVYTSIFPIGQSLMLAAGQVLTGCAWAGVWISIGLMCATLCWMLQGWVPPGWALAGAVMAAMRFGIFSYWMNSYFGGAVAAIGGALALGALPRLFRHRRRRDAVLFGAGIAILANSRPYEGMILCVPAIVAVAAWMARTAAGSWRLLFAMAAVPAAAAVFMAYYGGRISGNPLVLPYSFYRNTFTIAPHFIWQGLRPEPVYQQRVLYEFYAHKEVGAWQDARANRPPHGLFDKAKDYWRFYFGLFLTLPILSAPSMWARQRTRYLLLAAVWFVAALAVEVWHAPHYAAPAMGLMLLLTVEALRHLRQWRIGKFVVPVVLVGGALWPARPAVADQDGFGKERDRVVARLKQMGGRHLVVVRYKLGHDPGNEWVYNTADIDGAQVVWAREMDIESNRALVRYYAGRRSWLAEPDLTPPRLSPYDPSMPPDPPRRFVRLRNPEVVRRKVLDGVAQEHAPPYRFNCDQWDYYFTKTTGVEPPDPARGCFAAGARDRVIEFENWFAWLNGR